MKYKYKAKCSQCGQRFFAQTRSELLRKLRKHLWGKHSDWMKRRIQAGKKKALKKTNVSPDALKRILSPSWVGFAEKGTIEKLTGRPYEEVKGKLTDAFVQLILGSIGK